MGVQAAAARRVLTTDTQRATEQLRAVENSSRYAVKELQTMVYALRDSSIEHAALPGISELDDLIEQVRAAGQDVRFEIVDDDHAASVVISPAAELTVYRVVQESLSNARKHAGPAATTWVALRYLPDALEVDISDDGWGQSAPRPESNGTGTGLVGMDERVRAMGGTFTAGPKSRGGWLVRVHIPVSTERGNKMTAIRIVLVDDQPLIRHGFSAILESQPGFEVVGEARNGVEAVEVVA